MRDVYFLSHHSDPLKRLLHLRDLLILMARDIEFSKGWKGVLQLVGVGNELTCPHVFTVKNNAKEGPSELDGCFEHSLSDRFVYRGIIAQLCFVWYET